MNYNNLYYRKIFFDTTSQTMVYEYYKFDISKAEEYINKPINLFQKNDSGEFSFVKVFTFEKYQRELNNPTPDKTSENVDEKPAISVDKELVINPDGENYINIAVNLSKEQLLEVKKKRLKEIEEYAKQSD